MSDSSDPKEPRGSLHHDASRASRAGRPRGTRVEHALPPGFSIWLGAALIGVILIAAWPILTHLWWMERAGRLLDRYIVAGNPADLTAAGVFLDMWPAAGDSPARAAAAPPAPGSGDDTPAYWRTFGAVAARAPSQEAFALLRAAQERGRLDRIGRLWLGEVAAATGHWDVAEEVYSRLDAVNLLADRGDEAAASGDRQAAAHWYGAAAASLQAAADRPGSPGSSVTDSSSLDPLSSRATLLLRVGRGLLAVNAAEAALPTLELAESEMHAHPPSIRDQQAIRFALAEALVRTLPLDSNGVHPARTRIDTLMERALQAADTGWARLQQAKVLLLLSDRPGAITALRASLRLDPDPPEAYLELGAAFEADGLDSLARDLYERGLDHNPSHPELTVAWAFASDRTMAAREALPRLRQAAETTTREPYLFAALGDCLLELGDLEGARAAYHEGLRRAPGAAPLRDRLAKFARPTGPTF